MQTPESGILETSKPLQVCCRYDRGFVRREHAAQRPPRGGTATADRLAGLGKPFQASDRGYAAQDSAEAIRGWNFLGSRGSAHAFSLRPHAGRRTALACASMDRCRGQSGGYSGSDQPNLAWSRDSGAPKHFVWRPEVADQLRNKRFGAVASRGGAKHFRSARCELTRWCGRRFDRLFKKT